MGLVSAVVELSSPGKPKLKRLTVEAVVDTGAMTICIPEHIAMQLQLKEIQKREVTTADGRSHMVPYVGPLQICFEKRTCFTGALVMGESVLLGAIPLEDMDLVVVPSQGTIAVNPKSPNIPSVLVV